MDAEALKAWRERALAMEQHAASVVVGQPRALRLLIIAIFARGHALLEGDVGVGKTLLLRTMSRLLGGAYARVDGTIDLMPSDLVYYTYITEDGKPRVAPGPLLKHDRQLSIFFFNEINRARPQVQSLLLRVMAERAVSAFNREYAFPHVLVFADRNRVEREETFELASATRDRFMMEIPVGVPDDASIQQSLMFDTRYHDVDALIETLPHAVVQFDQIDGAARAIQNGITVSADLEHYAMNLWRATRDPVGAGIAVEGVDMQRLVLAGASPRGVQMLMRAARVAAWLNGRTFVTPDDIRDVFAATMTHRIFFQPVYEMRRMEIGPALVDAIARSTAAP